MTIHKLIDSHCHLTFPDFAADLEQALENARLNNVYAMQTICTKISEFDKIKALIEKYKVIYGSVGIHPHEVEKEQQVTAEDIIKLANHPKIIGIGETGLDYFYEHSNRGLQKKSFIAHIEAARELDLPIIIHTRSADDDTISILQEEMKKGPFRGVIHCFTAGSNLADAVLELGFYISISGIITFKNAENLRQTVKSIPLSRILVETDAPYLAPLPMRGKRNEPAYVVHTASLLADIFGMNLNDFSKITTENCLKLFKFPNID